MECLLCGSNCHNTMSCKMEDDYSPEIREHMEHLHNTVVIKKPAVAVCQECHLQYEITQGHDCPALVKLEVTDIDDWIKKQRRFVQGNKQWTEPMNDNTVVIKKRPKICGTEAHTIVMDEMDEELYHQLYTEVKPCPEVNAPIRQFTTGATRDTDHGKYDYEGFNDPLTMERFAQYMHEHRKQPDGTYRASDNWQAGMGRDVYMKSMWRHFMDVWKLHRGHKVFDRKDNHQIFMDEALCALWFNVKGYLFEYLKGRSVK